MSEGNGNHTTKQQRADLLRCTEINLLGQRCERRRAVGDKCKWHDPDRPRCEALKSNGEQCPNQPMRGTVVCAQHGGTSPEMQRHIKFQLLASVQPAIEVLNAAMEYADWPTAVRAAIGILDRSGFGPQSTVTIDDPAMRELATLTPEARLSQMEQILELMRTRAATRAAAVMQREANVDQPDQVM